MPFIAAKSVMFVRNTSARTTSSTLTFVGGGTVPRPPGGSLAALQQLSGHSTVVTTQRYAKLSDAFVAEVAGKLFQDGTPDGTGRQDPRS
jgi:hypothetical protein